jgi:glyoxylase-like metal-dependent hydrolase (beta-lactamase superfamily II)
MENIIQRIETYQKLSPQAMQAFQDEMKLLKDDSLNGAKLHHLKFDDLDVDVELSDGDIVVLGNDEIKFITTPGHTAGSGCYILNNHIFSGDTLFCRSIGRSDFWGGDQRTLLNSIKDKLYLFPDDTIVLPGHMGPTTIGDEKRGNPFV